MERRLSTRGAPTRGARGIEELFFRWAEEDDGSARIAAAAVRLWSGVDEGLAPILGQRGVTALYQRSLSIARTRFSWLPHGAGELRGGELRTLQTALLAQPPALAAAASGALLKIFSDLLTNLIGEALTERLLGSVWDNFSSGLPAQDTQRG
jgi:hypothetical protein